MATYWYPRDDVEIHVDDPGYGRLIVVHWSEDGRSCITIAGTRLGLMLRSLTRAATRERCDVELYRRDIVEGLWPMTAREASELLPAIQAAVIHAIAGSDRAERTLDDEAHAPMCVNCDVDQLWSSSNPRSNPWCEEHGHLPFGVADATYDLGGSWDRAQRRHAKAAAS